jgi:hypothetical protein
VRGGLDETGDRAGVGQDPVDLLNAGRLVDGHGDRTGRPDRVVDQRPLVARLAHQRDPVAGLDAGRDQALGQRHHIRLEPGAGDVLPAAVDRLRELWRVRRVLRIRPDRIGQVGVVGDRGNRRYRKLPHGVSCQSRPVTSYQITLVPAHGRGSVRGNLRDMADTSTQSIVMARPLAAIAEVICDFPRYPEWAGAMRSVEVIEEYEDGYASQVRFVIDAGVVQDEYVLAYEYAEDISRIEWSLVAPSRMQKAQHGSYDIEDNGDGTSTVTYTLSVELSIGVMGMFKRKAEKMIMDTALKELKRRVEAQQ